MSKAGGLRARYQAALESGEYQSDRRQAMAIELLEDLAERLAEHDRNGRGLSLLRYFRDRRTGRQPVQGLYFWGGVGRGKTWLVDMFFDCLPLMRKRRVHFHVFMQEVHAKRRAVRDRPDPLAIVAATFAEDLDVLCLDEFVVLDVADAVILARLLQALFAQGVCLVATSNIEPDELYRGGLQRDLFLPAIGLLKRHTRVFELDGGKDYRLQFLDNAEIYFTPLSDDATRGLKFNFDHIAPDEAEAGVSVSINDREIQTVRLADGIAWFEFNELCGGPRSQEDYIEIARRFHTVVLSDVMILDRERDDEARRLINLVDVLYDHNVNLLVSAAASPAGLYRGSRLSRDFRRTESRLVEMQSHAYLARPHAC